MMPDLMAKTHHLLLPTIDDPFFARAASLAVPGMDKVDLLKVVCAGLYSASVGAPPDDLGRINA